MTEDHAGLMPSTTRRELIRRSAGIGGVVLAGGALTELLAACGSSSKTSSAGLTPQDVKQATGTIKVLGYQFYQDDKFQNGGKVQAKWGYVSQDAELPAKAKPANSYDVVDAAGDTVTQFFEINRLQPIDTSLLTNYKSIAPAVRHYPLWKGKDGKIYAVPVAMAVDETGWDAASVPEPKRIQDLLKPEYKGVVGVIDSFIVLPATGLALGVSPDRTAPQKLTSANLKEIVSFLDKLKPQIRTLYAFGDEVNLFSRGDIKVAYLTVGSLIQQASKNGVQVKGNFVGSLTFADSWAITTDAAVAASLQWIDRFISIPGQKSMAKVSGSTPVVPAAVQPSVLQPELRIPFPQLIRNAPILGSPSTKAEGKYVGLEDLINTWNEFKASI